MDDPRPSIRRPLREDERILAYATSPRNQAWCWIRQVIKVIGAIAVIGSIVTAPWICDELDRSRSARHLENRALCQGGMTLIGCMLREYANDHGGRYPGSLRALVADGCLRVIAPNSLEVFVCPASKDRPGQGSTSGELASRLSEGGHLSYVYIGQGVSLSDPSDPEDTPLLYDEGPNHEGQRYVLFADGHARLLTDQQTSEVLARHRTKQRRESLSQ